MVSIVNHLHQQWPDAPIIGTAFSAGGHILMRYLETVGKNTPMMAALSFSGCFELEKQFETL